MKYSASRSARRALPLLLLLCACAGSRADGDGRGDVRYLAAGSARALSFDEVVDKLAGADVVVLGELHDSGPGHAAQLALTRALLERAGGGAIAMEQFERDVQDVVDDYVAGRIDRDGLAAARPWSNHDAHYHATLELARELDVRVLAANAPREHATRVGRGGADLLESSVFAPRWVELSDPEYRQRFDAALGGGGGGGHGAGGGLDEATLQRFFAAQVLRDASMAETVVDHIARGGARPVVLWCGRFHSDYGLGTVSRIGTRRPDLAVVVVSMERGDAALAARAEPPPGAVIIAVP